MATDPKQTKRPGRRRAAPALALAGMALAVGLGAALPALGGSDPSNGWSTTAVAEPSGVWDTKTQSRAGHLRPEDEQRAIDEGYPVLPFTAGETVFTGLDVVDEAGVQVGYLTVEVGYVSLADSRDQAVLLEMLEPPARTPEEQAELAEVQRQMTEELMRNEPPLPPPGG
ncbi:MAG TPA: hypothetical protein VK507_23085 [Iamia sp.]|nr:hypothetical protein [Iamia sp.]